MRRTGGLHARRAVDLLAGGARSLPDSACTMTSAARCLGKCSSKCSSTGTDTFVGQVRDEAARRRGHFGQLSPSWWMTRALPADYASGANRLDGVWAAVRRGGRLAPTAGDAAPPASIAQIVMDPRPARPRSPHLPPRPRCLTSAHTFVRRDEFRADLLRRLQVRALRQVASRPSRWVVGVGGGGGGVGLLCLVLGGGVFCGGRVLVFWRARPLAAAIKRADILVLVESTGRRATFFRPSSRYQLRVRRDSSPRASRVGAECAASPGGVLDQNTNAFGARGLHRRQIRRHPVS